MYYENDYPDFRAACLQRHEMQLPHTVCRVYPILLAAGAALSAAGTGMSIAGNEAAASKMREVRTAATAQQKRFQEQANKVFAGSLKTATATSARDTMKKGEGQRSAFYKLLERASTPEAAPLPATSSTSTNGVVDDTGARAQSSQTGRTNAWSNLQSDAQNRMGAYDDLNAQNAIANARATQDLSITSNKARGAANILPIELDVASHAGDSLSGWGQLVSALGSVAMLGSAAGIGAGAAAPSAATTSAAQSAAATGYAPGGALATRIASPIWKTLAPVTF